MTPRPLPRWFGRLLARACAKLHKGRAHKYLRKIPTGKTSKTGRPLYRYLYRVGGAGGIANEAEIQQGASFAVGTFWHEAAHTVEMASQDLGARIKDFVMHRIEKSKSYNYAAIRQDMPDEKGYKDDFIDAYTGRWYYQNGLGDETGSHVSEVLSMGGSYLGRGIKEFAKRDPEHLAFVLLALGGQLGLRDPGDDANVDTKVQQRIQQGTYNLASLRQRHAKG